MYCSVKSQAVALTHTAHDDTSASADGGSCLRRMYGLREICQLSYDQNAFTVSLIDLGSGCFFHRRLQAKTIKLVWLPTFPLRGNVSFFTSDNVLLRATTTIVRRRRAQLSRCNAGGIRRCTQNGRQNTHERSLNENFILGLMNDIVKQGSIKSASCLKHNGSEEQEEEEQAIQSAGPVSRRSFAAVQKGLKRY